MSSFFDFRMFVESSHQNGFSGNRIERWSEARDEESLAGALAAHDAGIYLFLEDRALLRAEGEALQPIFTFGAAELAGLDAESLILLGITPEGPRFAGLARADTSREDDIKAIGLRSLAIQGAVAPADLAALAQARSYLHWHSTNRFCGRCGGAMALQRGGVSRICTVCATESFPRVDPVVIMLAIDGERCLLGRQARFAPGMYSALAGFLEPGETIEEAVRREIKEEAGIRTGRVAYHSSQAWPFPASLMIGCHAEALSADVERDAAELEDCRWFERDEVRLMLDRTHPQSLMTPPKMAIAHHLIAAFAGWEAPV